MHLISGLGQGGAEAVLARLAADPAAGVRHEVVSLGGEGVYGPRLRAAGVPVHAMGMGRLPWRALAGLWRLWRLLRRERPDIAQTWMYHADLLGGLTARLAGVPVVVWGVRNAGSELGRASRLARLSAWCCAHLSRRVPDAIVACAADAARRHEALGYAPDRLRVIPNGYDLARWRPSAGDRARVRAEWDAAPDQPVVGCVARWNPLKDHANLLAALGRLREQWPELRIVLVGDGMTPDNPALMALVEREGLRPALRLLGRRDDVPAIMNGLDVHVLASLSEGFPNVVAEAMASGVPCVATDVGDAAEMLGGLGRVVPPRDPAALAQAVGAMLEEKDEPMMKTRLAQARERVAALYSLGGMRQAFESLWTGLAAGRRPSAMAPDTTTATAMATAAAAVGQPPRMAAVLPPAGVGPAAVGAEASAGAAAGAGAGPGRGRLLILVNNPAFFLSHRLPVALAAREAGYEVHVATMDGPSVAQIQALGLPHHVMPLTRRGSNPWHELRSLWAIWRLCRRLRPRILHAVTIKPVLYGGVAARLARVPGYVAAVSGLGFLFTQDQEGSRRWLRAVALALYRVALRHPNSRVIFQNQGDCEVLRRAGAVRPGQVAMIRGSGVDLASYPLRPVPAEPPVVVAMASRLLLDKGVREFVQAARLSAGSGPALRWRLAGSPDPGNPASVDEGQLEEWRRDGVADLLGECEDVAALYAQAHIVVLPSYREGLPKSLVEAAACGRAVVTTDVPGCRDAIVPNESGLLVPPRDAAALAEAVQRLAGDPALRQRMGEAGRRLAERDFDIRKVVQAHLEVYEAVGRAVHAPGGGSGERG